MIITKIVLDRQSTHNDRNENKYRRIYVLI